jgi:hypothetical protein
LRSRTWRSVANAIRRRQRDVHRHTPEGYRVALRAEALYLVRAEPFDAIELRVAARSATSWTPPPAYPSG